MNRGDVVAVAVTAYLFGVGVGVCWGMAIIRSRARRSA